MALKMCGLASGSRGNCVYVTNNKTGILIDQGLSLKQFTVRSRINGVENLNAILVTHEHTDHISGVKDVAKKFNVPIYVHSKIFTKFINKIGYDEGLNVKMFEDAPFEIDSIQVQPFRTPHDSIYSLGFKLSYQQNSLALATDLGTVNLGVYNNLKNCDAVFLEANHDVGMVKLSQKYSQSLKQRILGDFGHLSNSDSLDTVVKLIKQGTTQFLLGHISEENNTALHILSAMENKFKGCDDLKIKDVKVELATQATPSIFVGAM